MGESILIFGGGDNQRSLIIGAKELGYKTIVIDPNKDAIGRQYADVFEFVDTKDYFKTKEIAQKYNVKGIVTCQMENPLLMMAKLAEDLNFRFPSIESVKKARNKFLMKQAFLSANVPCAKGYLVSSVSEIQEKAMTYPAILKPVDAFSSRGVYKVGSIADCEKYFSETQDFSSYGKVIIEEFIEGLEYSVESITNDGTTYVIQVTEKAITPFPNTVEMAHIQPAEITQEEYKKIEKIVKRAIESLGLDNCATHAEVKLTQDGPRIIEIGARLGGDYITSHLVPLSTGINIEKLTIQVAMGDFKEVPEKLDNGAVIQYLNMKPEQKVITVENWEKLFKNKNLVHANINIKPGEYTKPITDSAKRAGFVVVKGNGRKEAIRNAEILIKELESCIKLNIMIENENIRLRPLKKNDLNKVNIWRNDIEFKGLTMSHMFPVTQDLEDDWFKNVLLSKDNRNIYFAIDTKADNNFIGMVYIKNIDWISKTCYFTIFIGDKETRGKKLGTQIMELAHSYIFKYLNLRKITLEVVSFNGSAIKLYQKMGYEKEGLLKEAFYYNNCYNDVIIMSIFKK